MQLNSESGKALDRWLASETWYKSNDQDMERFYDFVGQYQKEHGYSIEVESLQEEIADRAKVKGNEAMALIIRDRVSLAHSIIDFLKQTGR